MRKDSPFHFVSIDTNCHQAGRMASYPGSVRKRQCSKQMGGLTHGGIKGLI